MSHPEEPNPGAAPDPTPAPEASGPSEGAAPAAEPAGEPSPEPAPAGEPAPQAAAPSELPAEPSAPEAAAPAPEAPAPAAPAPAEAPEPDADASGAPRRESSLERRDRLRRLRVRRAMKILGLLVILGLAGFIGLLEYSASPSFCNNCHIMKPYYRAWSTSSHKDVACVECHYPPGTRDALVMKIQNINQVVKYVTRTYGSKPYADIEDASCLRSGCHSTRLLQGKVKFKQGIVFDHAPHISQERRGRHLRCTSCHAQMVVGNHMEVTTSTCFLCHFKGQMTAREQTPLGGCGVCHTAPDWDIKVGGQTFSHKDYVGSKGVSCQNCHHDVAQGDGHASVDRCNDCHNEPEKLAKVGDIKFLHENHVTKHDVSCNRCHTEITHKLTSREKATEPACAECHQSMHNAPRSLFLGQGGEGTPTIPSHMFVANVDCVACHVNPKVKDSEVASLKGQTFVASEAACTKCHGKTYAGMVGDWKKAFDTMLGQIEPRAAALEHVVSAGAMPAEDLGKAREALRAARHNIELVRLGRGLHNPFFAAELLHVANERLDEVAQMAGKDPKPLPESSAIVQGSCATLCHARAGVKPSKQVTLRGVTLPHAEHMADYGLHCTDCHSPEQHRQLRQDFKNCSACHHGNDKPSCATCHSAQADFYAGKLAGRTVKPNPMGEAMSCDACHGAGERPDMKTVAEACVGCHDEKYRQMPAEWESQGKAGLEMATKALAAAREAVERLPLGDRRTELARSLDEVDATLEGVRKGLVIHNPDGAREALDWVSKVTEDVKAQAASTVGEEPGTPAATPAAGAATPAGH